MTPETMKFMLRTLRWEIACGSRADESLAVQHDALVDAIRASGHDTEVENCAFDLLVL